MTTLAPHIQFVIALVGSLLGVLYQFSHNKTDAADGYNIPVRLISALCGWFLTSLLQYYLVMEIHWHFVLVAIQGFIMGLGIEKLIRLSMNRQNKAQSEQEIIDAWKQSASTMQGIPKPPTDSQEPPVNDKQS